MDCKEYLRPFFNFSNVNIHQVHVILHVCSCPFSVCQNKCSLCSDIILNACAFGLCMHLSVVWMSSMHTWMCVSFWGLVQTFSIYTGGYAFIHWRYGSLNCGICIYVCSKPQLQAGPKSAWIRDSINQFIIQVVTAEVNRQPEQEGWEHAVNSMRTRKHHSTQRDLLPSKYDCTGLQGHSLWVDNFFFPLPPTCMLGRLL